MEIQGAESYLSQLKSRRRKPGEGLRVLCNDIKDLVRLAYPEMTTDLQNRIGREYFKESLEDTELRQAIFRAGSKTLDGTMAAAMEWESFMKAEAQLFIDRQTNGQV